MNKQRLIVAPSMAFHALSDVAYHNAEGCIHIFFREGAGAPRPAQITRKADTGKELVCWKCGINSRPLPEGAVTAREVARMRPELVAIAEYAEELASLAKGLEGEAELALAAAKLRQKADNLKPTEYVCSSCSPLGVVCGGQLDRNQFDNWAIPERWRTEHDAQFSYRELVEYFIEHSADISSVPSARILFYRQNGLPWAKNATSANLARLGERERSIFVAFYWAGLSCAEIATCLEMEENAVKVALTRAKKKLF